MKNKIIQLFSLKDLHIRQVLKSAGYNFFTKVLGTLLGFVLSFILAHEFGSSVIGIIALLHSLISVALLVGSFGFPKAILRLIPEYKMTYGINGMYYIYIKVLKYVLLSSFLTMLIFIFLQNIIKENFFLQTNIPMNIILILTAVSIMTIALMRYNSQSLRALYSDIWFNTLILIPKILNIILLGIVVLLYPKPENAIYARILTDFAATIVSIIFLIIVFKRLNVTYVQHNEQFKKVWNLAWPMFLTGGLFIIMNQTDTLMLGYLQSPKDVGIYHIASRIAGITLFVLTAINYRTAPLYAELYHAQQYDKLKDLAQRTAKLMFWITLPIVIFLIFMGDYLLGLFGNEFTIGYYALLFIVSAEFIHSLSGSIGNFLNMTGHQKTFRNIILIGVSINIALNALLIPIYSFNGAAFASLVSMVLWNLIGALYIKSTFGYFIGYLPLVSEWRKK